MNREEIISRYERGTHRLGRLTTLLTLILLVGAPFLIGTVLGVMPDI